MKQSLKRKINYVVRKPLPIIKNTVFFQSFGGQYNDNPKYISETLHRLDPHIEIVWAVSDKGVDPLPSYVKQVRVNSKDYIKYSCRSQVLVDNMTGMRGFVSENVKSLLPSLMKSSRQLNISTWHGTPIKKIGLDILPGKKYMYTSADYLIAGCGYTRERLEIAYYPIRVIECGTPRNDFLVNTDSVDVNAIKAKLGLPQDKKIVLFAPTFRNDVDFSGVKQMNSFDIRHLLSLLKENVLSDEWVFVFRVHHTVLGKIDIQSLLDKYPNLIIDGNLHDDMAEYLAVIDVLITDYSGSIFDFALTGKPGFLYVPDKEHYIRDERGIYISLDELPYPHADNLTEFYKLIEEFDPAKGKKRIEEFNQKIGNAESGKASEIIARQIIKFIKTGEKEL